MTQRGEIVEVRMGVEGREDHERAIGTRVGQLNVWRPDRLDHQPVLLGNTAGYQGGFDQDAGRKDLFHDSNFHTILPKPNNSEWNLMLR
jgi:hypothetical protein